MEQLIDLQGEGYLRYWGTEDLTLIELLEDSDLFASMSADQMGFEDYLRSKNRQIDQIVFYALAEGCRGRLVREYFGEKRSRQTIVARAAISAIRAYDWSPKIKEQDDNNI